MDDATLIVSDHARWKMQRRQISESLVRQVVGAPEQVIPMKRGREARQSRISFPPSGKLYVVRVIVESGGSELRIVTVYRTSKLEKYWREQ